MKRCGFVAIALGCIVQRAAAADARLRSEARVGESLPGVLSTPRFASVMAGGSYPSSDGDVTTREGLGENVPYPGSDYLGMGYNVLYGNPDGDGDKLEDPGWRAPVIRFDWCQDAQCLSQDMQYLRPMYRSTPVGSAKENVACEMSKNVEAITTMNAYSSSLSVDADVAGSVGAFGGDVSFSASVGYANSKAEMEEGKKKRFQIKSYCTQFSLAAEPTLVHKGMRDPVFAAAVDALPRGTMNKKHDRNYDCGARFQYKFCFTKEEQAKWFAFFDTFGTHWATEVDLGGKTVLTTTIDESSGSSMSEESMSAAIAVSVDTAFAGGSASLKTSTDTSSMNAFKRATKKTHVSVFGGLPPKDYPVGSSQGFGQWAASVPARPMPIKYKLRLAAYGLYHVNNGFYETILDLYVADRKPLLKALTISSVSGLQSFIPPSIPISFASPHHERIECNSGLPHGKGLLSRNYQYRAGFNYDGNFIVWKYQAGGLSWKAVWQSGTKKANPSSSDRYTINTGRSCAWYIKHNGKNVWQTHADCGHNHGGQLILGNNGILYMTKGAAPKHGVWRSSLSLSHTAGTRQWQRESDVNAHTGWTGNNNCS